MRTPGATFSEKAGQLKAGQAFSRCLGATRKNLLKLLTIPVPDSPESQVSLQIPEVSC